MSELELKGIEGKIIELMCLQESLFITEVDPKDDWWEFEEEHLAYVKFMLEVKKVLKAISKIFKKN